VLDDQGHIRKHVAVFIDSQIHLPRDAMAQPVRDGCKVLVIQSLTGG
jgi:sulfur-carrier protein